MRSVVVFSWIFFIVGATGSNSVCPSISNGPVVCLSHSACIQGTRMPGFQIDEFDAFLGIPYAKPPVGNLRFANPEPSDLWKDLLIAKAAKPDCIQKNYLLPTPAVTGQEDCLYLNVFRPLNSSKKILPVMVYFYGGGFFAGTANPLVHGPEYFMDTKKIVLVTVAYRLGALGFLSTGDKVSPGNYALKDQNLALHWVKKYIKSFNGDPENVTIFGNSAGGASVHMHMLSPLSTGLFHRGIVMSGNAIAPYTKVISDPLKQVREQAKYCGIGNAQVLKSDDLIKALREIDAEKLVHSGDGFKYWHVDPLTVFRPVIEKNLTGSFLIEDPIDLVVTGNYHHVPWMTGFVPNEGAVRALSIISNDTLRNEFSNNFDYLVGKLVEMESDGRTSMQVIVNKLADFYFSGEHRLTDDNLQGLTNMISDRAFFHPLIKTLQSYVSYADLEKNPVYLYKFNYKGLYSYSHLFTGTLKDYGVVHCDELVYLFKSSLLFPNGFEKNSNDAKVVESFVTTFVNFATTGKPLSNDSLVSCNKTMLKKTTICDYLEYKNSVTSPVTSFAEVDNVFSLNAIRFWDEILTPNY